MPGNLAMAAVKGRGLARGVPDSRNAQALRRPGDAGMILKFGSVTPTDMPNLNTAYLSSEVNEICEKILKLDLSREVDFNPFTEKIKLLCQSSDDMVQCVDSIFTFALKSKLNAHVTAIFCNAICDITVKEAKFRTQILRKLQAAYKDKNKKYLELDSFLMDATFLYEIYHHVRIEDVCLKVLSRPVIDYFGMLVDGSSQKEIEVFVEQFPKCYYNLKVNDEPGLEILINKLRRQIIIESSNVAVRAMMVEIFEKVLTNFEPLSENAKNLYESLSKPIIRICE